MAQSRAKDIEEKEEAGLHKKAPQPLYDQLKAPDEGVADFQIGSSFDAHAALLAGANTDAQRSDLAMHLQKTYGNRYVQRLVESLNVQAKLTVGSPDDEYEREADKVADVVTRAPASSVQRQVPKEEVEEAKLSADLRLWITKGEPKVRQAYEALSGEEPNLGLAYWRLEVARGVIRTLEERHPRKVLEAAILFDSIHEALLPHAGVTIPLMEKKLKTIQELLNPDSGLMKSQLRELRSRL